MSDYKCKECGHVGVYIAPLPEEPDDLHREARFLESASTRDYAKKHPDVPAEEPPLCTTCGKERGAGPYCSNAFHIVPEEPRKCPACGTKLIPASQAFSEIRERITAEESPELTEAIEQIITELDACSGDSYNPPSLNTGAIKRELESIRATFAAVLKISEQRDAGITDLCALLRDVNNESLQTEDQVASLSSQLANERFEHRVTADSCEDLIAQRNSAESSLERLKAEQRETKLTDEEIRAILDDADNLGWQELTSDGQRAAYDRAIFKLRAKLRSRSQSDTGDTNG